MYIEERNRRILRSVESQLEQVKKDPEAVRRWFVEHGFDNPDGTLHENYGGKPYNPSASQR